MQINSNAIKQSVNNMQDNIDSLQLQLSKLSDVVNRIDSAWKSSSESNESTKFIVSIKEIYILSFQKLINNIDMCKDFLSKVPNVYQTFDDSYSNKNINV